MSAQTEHHGPRRSTLLAFLLVPFLAISLTSTSCSKAESKGKGKVVTTTTNLPPECKGLTTTSGNVELPLDCANAVFLVRIKEEGSDEIKALDPDKLIALGSATCTYAKVIATDGPVSTPFEDIVASNAKNWGISEKGVVEVMTASAVLCPNDIQNVLKMRDNADAIPVDYVATGPGELDITYTDIDGNQADITTHTPWEFRISLQQAGQVSMTVKMADGAEGNPRCSIKVKRKKLADKKGKDGVAKCTVAASDLIAAAN